MSTIVTRAGKGSALTHNEVDANFVNLNNDKLEAATTTTLSNKTIALGSNTVSGTLAQFNTAMTDADFATGGGTATGTNTGDQTSIVGITGTTAQFNTALTDGDFATLTGTETLTNKTLTSPTITGGAFNGTLGATTPSTVAATDLTTTGNTILGNASTDTLNVGNGDLVKDASGNVGIGTASPARKLDVNGSIQLPTNSALYIKGSDNYFYADGSNTVEIAAGTSGKINFVTNGASRAILDSSGNLGLGITPSTNSLAASGYKNLEIGGVTGYGLFAGGYENYLQSNTYYNSGFKYANSGQAALQYLQSSGQHRWYNAPSGTAGNAITFTQAMTLDASGNLGIGTTSPSSFNASADNLVVGTTSGDNGITVVSGTSSQGSVFFADGTTGGAQQAAGYIAYVHTSDYMALGTANTERMRITSGGEVYVAGTTDRGAFNLQCNGTGVWGAGAYTNGSDERIKNNIEPLATGLDVVAKLNPVTYKYNEDWSKDQSTQTGFIAQELLTALDGKNYVDGIVNQSSEYMSVAYQNIIPILTKAIQEQQALITSLTARLDAAGIA